MGLQNDIAQRKTESVTASSSKDLQSTAAEPSPRGEISISSLKSTTRSKSSSADAALDFLQWNAEMNNSSIRLGIINSLQTHSAVLGQTLTGEVRKDLKRELARFPSQDDQRRLLESTNNPEELVQLLASGAIDHLVRPNGATGLTTGNPQQLDSSKTNHLRQDQSRAIKTDNA